MKSVPKARYLLGKTSLPSHADEDTLSILKNLQNITNKEEYLRKSYELITKRFEGSRVKTLGRAWELFSSGTEDLFSRSGFLHCTNQNYLLANVLVKSEHFKEEDIQPSWTLIWFWSPHQYLKIKIDDHKTVNVDCWGRHYGIKFGRYAKGFNTSFSKSFVG